MKQESYQIYFMLAESVNRCKIGISTNLQDRLATLNTTSPVELTFLGSIPGDRSVEQYIHNYFDFLRVKGEWFHYESPLVEYIEEVINDATAPSDTEQIVEDAHHWIQEERQLKKQELRKQQIEQRKEQLDQVPSRQTMLYQSPYELPRDRIEWDSEYGDFVILFGMHAGTYLYDLIKYNYHYVEWMLYDADFDGYITETIAYIVNRMHMAGAM